jgi:hypothetical protein
MKTNNNNNNNNTLNMKAAFISSACNTLFATVIYKIGGSDRDASDDSNLLGS